MAKNPAFGRGVRPELMLADFSPILAGGQAMGQGLASAGASAGQAIKERGDLKKTVSAAESSMKALAATPGLDPKILGVIEGTQSQLSDPDLTLNQQAGIAEQAQQTVSRALQLGAYQMQRQELEEARLLRENQRKEALETGAAMADVLRTNHTVQGPAYDNPRAMNAARLAESGNIEGAKAIMNLPGEAAPIEFMGVPGFPGSLVLTQGGEYQTAFNAPQGPQKSAREVEIEDLMSTYNIPRAQAMGLVDRTTRLVTDPVNGGSSVVDMVTGEASRIEMPDALAEDLQIAALAPETGAGKAEINLYEMAQGTTGLIPAIQSKAQKVTGQLGIDAAPAELIENIQTYNAAQNEIIRALVINPRFNGTEIERIRKEISISPSALKDVKTLRSELRSVDRYLRNKYEWERRAAEDTALPVEHRRAALSAAKNIAAFLRITGVPQRDGPEVGAEDLGGDDIDALIQKYTGGDE